MAEEKNKPGRPKNVPVEDVEVNEKLKSEGWTVLRFWGRDIKKHTDDCVEIIESVVKKK